ncbi:hypothetical protein QCA50_017263 [Cerrena zonata]|uniref:GIY-YIG homing endonuclease n=1 Tax=Cerrena zonata TaxID=2478898 RepID=A0AAW0FL89_9APHY
MNSKYYAKILKSQGDELNEYDNNIPPEKLMEIFPSDNIVYVNNIPPDVMIERYRSRRSENNQLNDHRLVYVSSIPITGYTPSERIQFVKASTHKLLKKKYPRERLIYINSVTPKLLEMMTPGERAAVLNSDERNCRKEWWKIHPALSLEPSWDLPVNEAGCLELFQNYIGYPTTKFLSVAGHPIEVYLHHRTSDSQFSGSIRLSDVSGIPDVLYYKNNVPLVAVGLQGPDFSDLIEDGIDESSDAFKSIIRQVEIGELSRDLSEVVIPLRYRLFTLSSLGITVQAAFLAWLFFESAEEEKLHAERQKETGNHLPEKAMLIVILTPKRAILVLKVNVNHGPGLKYYKDKDTGDMSISSKWTYSA